MTKFVDEDELIGKTVSAVQVPEMDSTHILIAFADGTWTSIAFGGGYYPGEGSIGFDDYLYDSDRKWLADHGVTL